jgi:hypothetical protein
MPGTRVHGPELDELASWLATMPDGVVLSHRSAAAVWGLWIPAFAAVEVTSPAGDRGSRYTTSVQRRIVVAHRRLLSADDVTCHHGLPVTTLGRTWADLSTVLDIYDLVAAGDSALRAGASIEDLAGQVAGMWRVRGVRKARRAVAVLNEASRSRPESRIRAAITLAGLPEPKVNLPIYDRFGQWLAEPDLHYLEAKLALEYYGEDHADFSRMRRDSVRLIDMQREDWTTRVYTAPHAFQRLDDVVAEVRGLLLARAPQLLTADRLRAGRVTTSDDQRRRIRRL